MCPNVLRLSVILIHQTVPTLGIRIGKKKPSNQYAWDGRRCFRRRPSDRRRRGECRSRSLSAGCPLVNDAQLPVVKQPFIECREKRTRRAAPTRAYCTGIPFAGGERLRRRCARHVKYDNNVRMTNVWNRRVVVVETRVNPTGRFRVGVARDKTAVGFGETYFQTRPEVSQTKNDHAESNKRLFNHEPVIRGEIFRSLLCEFGNTRNPFEKRRNVWFPPLRG